MREISSNEFRSVRRGFTNAPIRASADFTSTAYNSNLMSNRIPLSKKIRFDVLSRDNFTCKYCGRQSDVVTLHIDHVIPVIKGGTNGIENLITSCADCNLGKGPRPIDKTAVNEQHRLMLAQERNEQMEAAAFAMETAKARNELKQHIVNFWCDSFGVKSLGNSTVSHLASLSDKHGITKVFSWIGIATERFPYSKNELHILRYIYGIRRRHIQEQEASK